MPTPPAFSRPANGSFRPVRHGPRPHDFIPRGDSSRRELSRLPAPLSSCGLGGLRLLAGFTLGEEGTARGARSFLLEQAGVAGEPSCIQLYGLVGRLLIDPRLRSMLDCVLAARLGAWARRYEGWCVAKLASCWWQERDILAGPPLAAFFWMLARSNAPAFRRIATKVADELDPSRLLSPLQGIDRPTELEASSRAVAGLEASAGHVRWRRGLISGP